MDDDDFIPLEQIPEYIMELREQNRVLREALKPFAERWEYFEHVPPVNGKEWDYYHCYADEEPSFVYLGQLKAAKAALTATRQPATPAGKMHACDIPGCVSCGNPEDTTSQEGQHGSR